MNDCDAGVRIGDVRYNSMAHADDITIFSTNVKCLQCLIDMCTMYIDRRRFKYGIEKSKCMIIGKSPFTCEPVRRLNDVSLRILLKQWKSLAMCSIARAITPVMLTTG